MHALHPPLHSPLHISHVGGIYRLIPSIAAPTTTTSTHTGAHTSAYASTHLPAGR